MKHWIGVMCVGAAFAIAGLLSAPEDAEGAAIGSATETADQVSTSLLTLGAVLGIIGLVGLARGFMQKTESPPPPQ
jgi:hypothetical protein